MDPNLLLLLLIALCLLVIGGILRIYMFTGEANPAAPDTVNPVAAGGDRQPRGRNRAGLGRMARMAAEPERPREEEAVEAGSQGGHRERRREIVEDDDDDEMLEELEEGAEGEHEEDQGTEDGGDGADGNGGEGSSRRTKSVKRLGKKKAEKLERKEEKRKLREYQAAMREERKKQEEEYEEERKLRRQEEREQEAEEERLEKKRLEEIARAEEEEYRLLKRQFVVEESGVHELSPEEVAELLEKMARYIYERKVVTAEELASEFQIKTQEAVARLRQLDKDGRIQGVLDERGKYVFITQEEFEAVAQFIKKRGRVSKEELAAASNKLVNLNPKTSSSGSNA